MGLFKTKVVEAAPLPVEQQVQHVVETLNQDLQGYRAEVDLELACFTRAVERVTVVNDKIAARKALAKKYIEELTSLVCSLEENEARNEAIKAKMTEFIIH
jgi:uncharacterized protein YejL (UPF0352 family)